MMNAKLAVSWRLQLLLLSLALACCCGTADGDRLKMAHIMSEFSNEIYDLGAADNVNLVKSDGVCPYTVFLGVFVSLIPKIIPRILPNFVKESELRERFDSDLYSEEVEHMFREKFSENLQLFEKVVRAWKENTLDLEDYGFNLDPNNPLAKEDLVTGEPESFQDDLLKGIRFLKYRVSRMGEPNDRIERLANTVWNVANAVYTTIYTLFKPSVAAQVE